MAATNKPSELYVSSLPNDTISLELVKCMTLMYISNFNMEVQLFKSKKGRQQSPKERAVLIHSDPQSALFLAIKRTNKTHKGYAPFHSKSNIDTPLK